MPKYKFHAERWYKSEIDVLIEAENIAEVAEMEDDILAELSHDLRELSDVDDEEVRITEATMNDMDLPTLEMGTTEISKSNEHDNVNEYVEVCPYCGNENIYRGWNTEKQGYIVTCGICEKQIFLCDACLHSEDNPNLYCNWDRDGKCSVCWRGEIRRDDL